MGDPDGISSSEASESGREGLFRFVLQRGPAEDAPYRRVLFTTDEEQYVEMCLRRSDGPLGLEKHAGTTQTFYFMPAGGGGTGTAPPPRASIRVGDKRAPWRSVADGEVVVVPADTWHDLRVDDDNAPLVFLTTYAPPHFPPNLVQRHRPPRVPIGPDLRHAPAAAAAGSIPCSICNERSAVYARTAGSRPFSCTGTPLPMAGPFVPERVEYLCVKCHAWTLSSLSSS